jgi:LPXTG-motif cell wall-anchored protein
VVDWAIGLVGAGLLAIDVGLLLARRRRPRRG